MMLKTSKASSGFTLIELAIVIAIIAILAVAAIMRMGGNTAAASRASAYAAFNQINSAYALYLARQMSEPTAWGDFVNDAGSPVGAQTLGFDTNHPCTGGISGATLTCSYTDLSGDVVFTLDTAAGTITHNIAALTLE